MIGVELDQGWWNSKYAKNKFIPMVFTEETDSGPKGLNSENAVLLFCYFNNEPAFLNYIQNFKGDCFISKFYFNFQVNIYCMQFLK